jgi:hypothetical protein
MYIDLPVNTVRYCFRRLPHASAFKQRFGRASERRAVSVSIDRRWSHKVALSVSARRRLNGFTNSARRRFLSPRGHSVAHNGQWFNVYCFAEAAYLDDLKTGYRPNLQSDCRFTQPKRYAASRRSSWMLALDQVNSESRRPCPVAPFPSLFRIEFFSAELLHELLRIRSGISFEASLLRSRVRTGRTQFREALTDLVLKRSQPLGFSKEVKSWRGK